MQKSRSGPLYSPLGCGTAALMVLILGVILFFKGGTPFSPGPLTAAQSEGVILAGFSAHSEFEETCSQCHEPWRKVGADRCLTCHTNEAQERQENSGLHGNLPSDHCQDCHTDHKGRSAEITVFDLTNFDHDWSTGFSLAQHQVGYDGLPIDCSGCHLNEQYAANAIDCIECHKTADPVFIAEHQSFYGDDCRACHDGQDSMIAFDHQQVFPLEGAHAVIECRECHVAPVLSGTGDECRDCHEEPEIHKGKFGLECGRCHTSTAWIPAQLSQHTFPLDHGDQGKVECQVCHTQSYTIYTCYNCHAHEPSETRALHEREGIVEIENCIECHADGRTEETGQETARLMDPWHTISLRSAGWNQVHFEHLEFLSKPNQLSEFSSSTLRGER